MAPWLHYELPRERERETAQKKLEAQLLLTIPGLREEKEYPRRGISSGCVTKLLSLATSRIQRNLCENDKLWRSGREKKSKYCDRLKKPSIWIRVLAPLTSRQLELLVFPRAARHSLLLPRIYECGRREKRECDFCVIGIGLH